MAVSRSHTGFGQANVSDPNLAMQRQVDNSSARFNRASSDAGLVNTASKTGDFNATGEDFSMPKVSAAEKARILKENNIGRITHFLVNLQPTNDPAWASENQL